MPDENMSNFFSAARLRREPWLMWGEPEESATWAEQDAERSVDFNRGQASERDDG